MYRVYLILVFVVGLMPLYNTSNAQLRFNRSYVGPILGFNDIKQVGNSYISKGGGVDVKLHSKVFKHNQYGDIIDSLVFKDTVYNYYIPVDHSFMLDNENLYSICVRSRYVSELNQSTNILLAKIDLSSLDTIMTRRVGDSLKYYRTTYALQSKISDAFYFYGVRSDSLGGYKKKAYAIKTDTNGVVKWEKEYNVPFRHQLVADMVELPNGDLAMVYQTYQTDPDHPIDTTKAYIRILDSNGVQKAVKNNFLQGITLNGSLRLDANPVQGVALRYVLGGASADKFGDTIFNFVSGLDSNFNPLWETRVKDPYTIWTRACNKVGFTPDGKIYMASHHDTYAFTGLQLFYAWGGLFDGEGNWLWGRQLRYDAGSVHYMYSAAPTSDGGLVFVGELNSPGPNPQSGWMIKVDSLGCVDPANCWPMSVPYHPKIEKVPMVLYPNPNNGELQIRSYEKELEAGTQIQLSDMMGRVLYSYEVAQPSSYLLLDLKALNLQGVHIVAIQGKHSQQYQSKINFIKH